jgi:hypothetical protein
MGVTIKMEEILSKLKKANINSILKNHFDFQEECRKKGHANEKVISYGDVQALCICGNCKDMYTRPSTYEERKKYYNLINTPMTI